MSGCGHWDHRTAGDRLPGPAESQSRHSDPMCGGLARKWRPSSMNMANAARAAPASTNCRMRTTSFATPSAPQNTTGSLPGWLRNSGRRPGGPRFLVHLAIQPESQPTLPFVRDTPRRHTRFAVGVDEVRQRAPRCPTCCHLASTCWLHDSIRYDKAILFTQNHVFIPSAHETSP